MVSGFKNMQWLIEMALKQIYHKMVIQRQYQTELKIHLDSDVSKTLYVFTVFTFGIAQ